LIRTAAQSCYNVSNIVDSELMDLYFYRILFSSLCFIFFGIALATQEPASYLAAMCCGALAMTAKRKMWDDPVWAELYMQKFDEFRRRMYEKYFHRDFESEFKQEQINDELYEREEAARRAKIAEIKKKKLEEKLAKEKAKKEGK
jgi:hypothetical protein